MRDAVATTIEQVPAGERRRGVYLLLEGDDLRRWLAEGRGRPCNHPWQARHMLGVPGGQWEVCGYCQAVLATDHGLRGAQIDLGQIDGESP